MENHDIIMALKKEANVNPASAAVFETFANRKRARSTVTLVSLHQRMKTNGYKFKKDEYIPAIRLLASLGFGELDFNRNGKVKGLKNVKITLQSIGEVASGTKTLMSTMEKKNKYSKMPKPKVLKEAEVDESHVDLGFFINGKAVHITVPKELTPEEITSLIKRLYN